MSATKINEGAESQRESAVLDQLLEGCEKPEDLLAPGGAFNRLRKRLIERVLGTELTVHLGYDKGQKPPGNGVRNIRRSWPPGGVRGNRSSRSLRIRWKCAG